LRNLSLSGKLSLSGRVAAVFNFFALLIVLTLPFQALAASSDYKAGEYVIKYSPKYIAYLQSLAPELKEKTEEFIIQALNREIGTTPLQKIPLVNAELVKAEQGLDVEFVLDLIDSGVIEYIEPHFLYRPSAVPQDPDYSRLWGLSQSSNIDIDAPEAWDITTGSNDVVVGVIDTGVNLTHPDLAANIWVNRGEIPGNGIDDDRNGYIDDLNGWNGISNAGNPDDDQSHGSHCAGTIGGVGNNNIGLTGVAWNVKLMALKFLPASGGGSIADAIDVMNYAIKQKELFLAGNGGANITILNNSWGGGGYSSALAEAILRANAVGILFVAAAGNNGTNNDQNPFYPAAYTLENVLTVAALDPSGAKANFSNYGATTVHVAAPGVQIYSSVLGQNYATYQGTSMAAPHVSGIAALVQSRWPGLPPRYVKEKIQNSITPLSNLQGLMTHPGLVNAFKAVYSADFDIPPTIQSIANQEMASGTGSLSVNIQAADFEGAPISLSATINSRGVSPTPTASFSGSTLNLQTSWLVGIFDVQVTATANGKSSSTSFTVTIKNLPPVIQPIANQNYRLAGGKLTVPVQIADPDGDTFTVTTKLKFLEDLAHELDQRHDFYYAGDFQNVYGSSEKLFFSWKDYRWCLILPNGAIYPLELDSYGLILTNKIAQLSPAFYSNIRLITDPAPRTFPDPLTVSYRGSNLEIQALDGTKSGESVVVVVTASNISGSDQEEFTVFLKNDPPTLATIADQNVNRSTNNAVVSLSANDPDGDPLTFSATVLRPGESAYALDQTHNFFVYIGLQQNAHGRNEKWLYGKNGWYFLMPDGTIYDYVENVSPLSLTQPLIKLGESYYANPLLLVDAPAPNSAPLGTVVTNGTTLTITPQGSDFITVRATVSDGIATDSKTFNVTAKNAAPTLAAISDRTLSRATNSTSVTVSASDPDGDSLTISATVLRPGELAQLLDQKQNFFVNGSLHHNVHGRNEKWLYGNGGWFFIMPDGTIYDYVENVSPLSLAQPIAKLEADYYANPLLLVDAPAPTLPAEGVASVSGTTVTVTPNAGFGGVLTIRVTASDGLASDSKFFSVIKTNATPTLAPISDRTLSRAMNSTSVTVSATDPDGDPLTFSAAVLRPGELAQILDQKQNFFVNGSLHHNVHGQNEKWLFSAVAGWFFILPDGTIYDYVENVSPLSFAQPVAKLGAEYHTNPLLLVDAPAPTLSANGAATVSGTTVTVTPNAGFGGVLTVRVTASDGLASDSKFFSVTKTNAAPTLSAIPDRALSRAMTSASVTVSATDPDGDPLTISANVLRPGELAQLLDQKQNFFVNGGLHHNVHGINEKWLYSDTGWFFILPDGTLYDYVENVSPVSLAQPVAKLETDYYANPLLLVDAPAPTLPAEGVATVSGTTVTVTPNTGFGGVLTIRVTASDGLAADSKFFSVTKTNAAPTLASIADRTLSRAMNSTAVTVSASDPDGDPLTISANVLRPGELAQLLDQKQNFFVNGGLHHNVHGINEKWLYSDTGWFFILPDGTLYDYVENVSPVSLAQPIAKLGTEYYTNPLLLVDAPAPTLSANGAATVSGTTVTVTPNTGFGGVLTVRVTASDGIASDSKFFSVTKTNVAPTLAAISDQSTNQASISISLSATDTDGDPLTFSGAVLRAGEFAYLLDQKHNFFVNGGLFHNFHGLNEKWLYSNQGWFFLLPDGTIYDYVENVTPVSLAQPVGKLGATFYANPLLLVDAAAPTAVADGSVSVSGNNLIITPKTGFSGVLNIQATVSDGLASHSRIFNLTVESSTTGTSAPQSPQTPLAPQSPLSPSSPSSPIAPTPPANDDGEIAPVMSGILVPFISERNITPILTLKSGKRTSVTLSLHNSVGAVLSRKVVRVSGTTAIDLSALTGFRTTASGLLRVEYDTSTPIEPSLTYRRALASKVALIGKLPVISPVNSSAWSTIPPVFGAESRIVLANVTTTPAEFTATERAADGTITNLETFSVVGAGSKVIALSGNSLSASVEITSNAPISAQLVSSAARFFEAQNFIAGSSEPVTLPVSRRTREETLLLATNTSESSVEINLTIRDQTRKIVLSPQVSLSPESTTLLKLSDYLPAGRLGSVEINSAEKVIVSTTIIATNANGSLNTAIQVDRGDSADWQNTLKGNLNSINKDGAKKKPPKKK